MPRTSAKKSESRAAVIKALGHPSRLLIAEALMKGEMCVCDLKDLVGADMSTVSKHLSILKNAGIVTDEKRGLKVFYRLCCPCLTGFIDCVEGVLRRGLPRAGIILSITAFIFFGLWTVHVHILP
jgi:ArsR family transcriptional regulator